MQRLRYWADLNPRSQATVEADSTPHRLLADYGALEGFFWSRNTLE